MSRLDHYLSHLMGDDDALRAFLGNPLAESEKHGLTKAERSVLRRVLSTGSTASVNGYAIVKPLSSYRLSAKLLQNVLHSNRSHPNMADSDTTYDTMYIYFGPDPSDPSYSPFSTYVPYSVPVPSGGSLTLGDVVGYAQDNFGLEITTEEDSYGNPIITSITNPNNGEVYNAPPSTQAGVAFWAYQIWNGSEYVDGPGGSEDTSYVTQTVTNGYARWAVIVPNGSGGGTCPTSDGAHTANLA